MIYEELQIAGLHRTVCEVHGSPRVPHVPRSMYIHQTPHHSYQGLLGNPMLADAGVLSLLTPLSRLPVVTGGTLGPTSPNPRD